MIARHAWWKPTADTVAAYLSLTDTRRLLAGSAMRAPEDWQRTARKTLGERLGRLLLGTARTTASVASLGLSEIMYRLAQPGSRAAAQDIPPLDLVVGPLESAVLIVDGAVSDVLTAERAQTHGFWQQLDRLLGVGPHLEVVMIDLAPRVISAPLVLEVEATRLDAMLELEVAFDQALADKALALLATHRHLTGGGIGGAALTAAGPTFADLGAVSASLQRRLQMNLPAMGLSGMRAADLRADPAVREALQAKLREFAAKELFAVGIALRRIYLQVPASPEAELELRRKTADLDRATAELELEVARQELRRQQELAAEREQLAAALEVAKLDAGADVDRAREAARFSLARMVLQDDNQLAVIEREGFARRRESERTQEQLDVQHQRMVAAQVHTAQLERELASAKNAADVQRIQFDLEREKLQLAALAQEQNLLNLRKIKEIEREDDLARSRDAAEQERARFAAAGTLSPEQMLAALADKNPEVAKALAAKFAADGASAQRSAADQIQLMKAMQAEMASMMRDSLQANAQVARGMVDASARVHSACAGCGKALQPQWKACPYCGGMA